MVVLASYFAPRRCYADRPSRQNWWFGEIGRSGRVAIGLVGAQCSAAARVPWAVIGRLTILRSLSLVTACVDVDPQTLFRGVALSNIGTPAA